MPRATVDTSDFSQEALITPMFQAMLTSAQ